MGRAAGSSRRNDSRFAKSLNLEISKSGNYLQWSVNLVPIKG